MKPWNTVLIFLFIAGCVVLSISLRQFWWGFSVQIYMNVHFKRTVTKPLIYWGRKLIQRKWGWYMQAKDLSYWISRHLPAVVSMLYSLASCMPECPGFGYNRVIFFTRSWEGLQPSQPAKPVNGLFDTILMPCPIYKGREGKGMWVFWTGGCSKAGSGSQARPLWISVAVSLTLYALTLS